MGLLKRLLQEKKEGGLLKRAVILKNYEFESDGERVKKKDSRPLNQKASQLPKKA